MEFKRVLLDMSQTNCAHLPDSATASALHGSARHDQLSGTAADHHERRVALESFISDQDAFVSSDGAYSGQRGRDLRKTDKRDRSQSRDSATHETLKVSFIAVGTTGRKEKLAGKQKKCDVRRYRSAHECKNEATAKDRELCKKTFGLHVPQQHSREDCRSKQARGPIPRVPE